jgi:hypothetical protein
MMLKPSHVQSVFVEKAMKSQTFQKFTQSNTRQAVLPANTSAYVAELTRDPAKARAFLVRAGILKALPRKKGDAVKRSASNSVTA